MRYAKDRLSAGLAKWQGCQPFGYTALLRGSRVCRQDYLQQQHHLQPLIGGGPGPGRSHSGAPSLVQTVLGWAALPLAGVGQWLCGYLNTSSNL